MPPIPVLRPWDVVKAFKKLGWEVARQRSSHIILTKPGHIATLSVPNQLEMDGNVEELSDKYLSQTSALPNIKTMSFRSHMLLRMIWMWS